MGMPIPDYTVDSILELSWRSPADLSYPATSECRSFRVRVVGPQGVEQGEPDEYGDGFGSREIVTRRWQRVEYISGTVLPSRTTLSFAYLWLSGNDTDWEAGYGLQISNLCPYEADVPDGYLYPREEHMPRGRGGLGMEDWADAPVEFEGAFCQVRLMTRLGTLQARAGAIDDLARLWRETPEVASQIGRSTPDAPPRPLNRMDILFED